MLLNSVIITKDSFRDERGMIVPESGIEDRYNTFIHDVCNDITSYKDNNADGIIRINNKENIIYGLQEVKRLATSRFVLESALMQSLSYVAEFKMKYPLQIDNLKFLILPTETQVSIVLLKDINKQLLDMFIAMYIPCKMSKLFTASTVYSKKSEAPELDDIFWMIYGSIKDRIKTFTINEELDYKEVVEYILNNI